MRIRIESRAKTRSVAIMAAAFLFSSMVAVAGSEDPAVPGGSGEAIEKTEFVRQEFRRLLVKMQNLARSLEEKQPEVADILKRTHAYANRELIEGDMEAVARQLRKGLDNKAVKKQGMVIARLKQMLKMIEGGVQDETRLEKRITDLKGSRRFLEKSIKNQEKEEKKTRPAAHRGEIDKNLAGFIENLRQILKKQKDLKKETDEADDSTPALKKLGLLRQELRDLIKKQGQINTRTGEGPLRNLPVLCEAQERTRKQVDQLGEKLKKAASGEDIKKLLSKTGTESNIKKASGETKKAAEEMKRSSDSLGKSNSAKTKTPQKQAVYNLKEAEKLLNEAIRKAGESTDSGKLAGRQKNLGKDCLDQEGKLDEIAKKAGIDPESIKVGEDKKTGSMEKAAGHMSKAVDSLETQQRDSASKDQDKAVAELEKQLLRAEELRRRIKKKLDAEIDPGDQKKIAEDLGELEKKMKQAGSEDGEDPARGTESVAGAKNSASSAAEKIAGGKEGYPGANKDQQDVLRRLRKVWEKLDEEIARLKRKKELKKLANVEQLLDGALKRQKNVTLQTGKVREKGPESGGKWDRAAKQKMAELGEAEGNLADDMSSLRKRLLDEETTVVFPEMLGDVVEDLKELQKRLARYDPGIVTGEIPVLCLNPLAAKCRTRKFE